MNKKITEQVKRSLEAKGQKKIWLANKLGVDRSTLYARFKDHAWTTENITILKNLGLYNPTKQ